MKFKAGVWIDTEIPMLAVSALCTNSEQLMLLKKFLSCRVSSPSSISAEWQINSPTTYSPIFSTSEIRFVCRTLWFQLSSYSISIILDARAFKILKQIELLIFPFDGFRMSRSKSLLSKQSKTSPASVSSLMNLSMSLLCTR